MAPLARRLAVARGDEPADLVVRGGRVLSVFTREPFLTLAFLALSVIPSLKITDQGLVGVDRCALVPLNAAT
jgi:adenine deaminase